MAYVDINDLTIDKEFEELLPSLSQEDYNMLEQSLLKSGFDQNFGRIKVWFPKTNNGKGYIVDGHNRFKICQKHNIDLPSWCFDWLCFDTKEEVKKYIYENQLARRNLTPIQKISIAERYRSIYEKQAKENQIKAGSNYGVGKEKPLPNLVNPISAIDTTKKLAEVAGVSKETYRMGAKILNSDNEETEKRNRAFEKEYKEALINDNNKCKNFYKQCYKTLAKSVHLDEGGNEEAMQCLNQLKVMWGV